MGEAPVFFVKHARTGMYVARVEQPRAGSYRMPCRHWKWVRTLEEATPFERSNVIHPIIQMDIWANAVVVDVNDVPQDGAA